MALVAITLNSYAQTIPSYVPTNGLEGWWPFNGNANDESGNGINGTVNDAVLTSDRFGNSNAAYDFDGVNDYIVLSTTFPGGANSKSFSVWFNLTGNTYHWVISGGATVNGQAFGLFYNSQASNRLTFHGNGATYDYEFSNIAMNQWNHVVITFNNGQVQAYLNGQYIGFKNVALNTSIANNITVGCRNNNTAFFPGKIDDIGIWNRALSQQEVTNLFNATATGINQLNHDISVNVFPNPASNQIIIDNSNFPLLDGCKVQIQNLLGQQVFFSPIYQQPFYIDISGWERNGLYCVNIFDSQNNRVDVRKITLE